MNNLDKIKFKEAGNGEFIKISLGENGQELSRSASFGPKSKPLTMGAGFYKEMIDSGLEIEPQYTAEELEQKEVDDLDQAIENQKSQSQGFLKATDYKLLPDFEYQDDVPALKILRLEWKRIIKSNQLETVPEKPF